MPRHATWATTLALLAAFGSGCGGVKELKRFVRRHFRQDGDSLVAATGFKIAHFAHVADARFMALGPDGALYVSQPGLGQVVRLVGVGHDTADSAIIVATGLDLPHGLAFHGGYLYVAGHGGVVRLTLGEHGRTTEAPVLVNHYTAGMGHETRTIVFGSDSGMYVSIGSSCNLCVEQDSDRAVVMRYDETGGHGRVFARGLRNAVGLALDPTSGALWATVNERDNLAPDHENLPPDRLDILRDGGDYGWPYCYGDHKPNPEYHDTSRCAGEIPPVLGFQAHSAPLGMAFYRGDALVAFHGSWNRRTPTGAKVVRVHIAGGRPTGYDDFVTGWQRRNGSRWGRPVDVVVAGDGAIFVSDDYSGTIYKMVERASVPAASTRS